MWRRQFLLKRQGISSSRTEASSPSRMSLIRVGLMVVVSALLKRGY